MLHLDQTPPPSWAVPIAVGAFSTFLLLELFRVGQALPMPAVQVAAFCCCSAGFLPYGFLPAWIAARRDPTLTNGQGFALAFIAVGLGTVTWAMLSLSAAGNIDPVALRDAFEQAQQQLPPEQQMSEAELDQMVEATQTLLPFVPAIYAAVTTVLAGFIGMVTVGMARRRRRSPPRGAD